jgi:tryptophan-rich sensory protein
MTETILIAAALAIVLAAAGGLLTDIGPWYRNLRKPSWQPPDWAFGPAWTIILSLTATAGVLSWQGAHGHAAHVRVLIYFGVNWVLHLLWSPLFFKLRRPDWALLENYFLLGSVAALVIGLREFSTTASLLEIPYLLWVSFALWLNWTIVRLNAPFGRAAVPA